MFIIWYVLQCLSSRLPKYPSNIIQYQKSKAQTETGQMRRRYRKLGVLFWRLVYITTAYLAFGVDVIENQPALGMGLTTELREYSDVLLEILALRRTDEGVQSDFASPHTQHQASNSGHYSSAKRFHIVAMDILPTIKGSLFTAHAIPLLPNLLSTTSYINPTSSRLVLHFHLYL